MALIPQDKIAEIRDRTDIVAVIGEHVTLRRAGTNWKGLCPFHIEKNPSFNVNPQKQFFHCFGCNKSGDVFSFLQEVNGESFNDVMRDLARKAGVELPEIKRSRQETERANEIESQRSRMIRLNELVAGWFEEQLRAPIGAVVLAYVNERGIGDAIQRAFRVGYAPAGWDALTNFLAQKRVPHELAEQCGLIRRREQANLDKGAPPSKATHFDVFVDRVVYALTSPQGEVIGFGGRLYPKANDKANGEVSGASRDSSGEAVPSRTPAVVDQPKYKNSPETLIYKKGENLFGLHIAKQPIRKGGRALLVEGNFDVMTLHQAGIDYVVAPQGTAITEAQVALVSRFADKALLMLDADPAGRAATLKVIHLFVEAGLPAFVVQLRTIDGKKTDPDDLARRDLPRLKALIESAAEAVEFFFRQVAANATASVPGRVQALEECVPLLRAVKDPIARDMYITLLARLLEVDVGLVRRALAGARGIAPQPAVAVKVPTVAAPTIAIAHRGIEPTLEKLIAFFNYHGGVVSQVGDDIIANLPDRAIAEILQAAKREGAFTAAIALSSAAPEIRNAVAKALLSEEFAPAQAKTSGEPADPRKIFASILTRLSLPNDPALLEQERQRALAAGDKERVQAINARILGTNLSTRKAAHGGNDNEGR